MTNGESVESLPNPPWEWQQADLLQALIDNEIAEDLHLEYKTNGQQRPFPKSVYPALLFKVRANPIAKAATAIMIMGQIVIRERRLILASLHCEALVRFHLLRISPADSQAIRIPLAALWL